MIVSFPKVSCFSVLNWVWIVRQENQSSLLFLSFFSIFNVFSLSLPPLSFFLKSLCMLPVFFFLLFVFSLFSLFLSKIRVLFFQKPLIPSVSVSPPFIKVSLFSVFFVFSVIYFFNYLFKTLTDKSKLLYFLFYLFKQNSFFYIFILKLANQV